MALYKNVSAKRLMIAGVKTVVSYPWTCNGQSGLPFAQVMGDNKWLEPGEVAEFSDADAAALGPTRVERVDTPPA